MEHKYHDVLQWIKTTEVKSSFQHRPPRVFCQTFLIVQLHSRLTEALPVSYDPGTQHVQDSNAMLYNLTH